MVVRTRLIVIRTLHVLLFLRRTERDMIENEYWSFMQSTLYPCPILMKLEHSRQFFEIYSNIKFHENLSSGIRVISCGRTDRHDEANCDLSQFCDTRLKTPVRYRPSRMMHW
jgi:hypothetical protein